MMIELRHAVMRFVSSVSLNPYSNGMKIELSSARFRGTQNTRLNPYSDGMKIEQFIRLQVCQQQWVLILILME